MLSCGCVIGSRCHRHTLMVANLRHRFGDDKYTRVSHAPVDEGNETMNERDETQGLGASAQGDGDTGGESKPTGEATETAEAPATTGDPGDENDVAQTN